MLQRHAAGKTFIDAGVYNDTKRFLAHKHAYVLVGFLASETELIQCLRVSDGETTEKTRN